MEPALELDCRGLTYCAPGGTGRRLAEAARQGYTTALVPEDAGPAPQGMRLIEVPDLGALFARLW